MSKPAPSPATRTTATTGAPRPNDGVDPFARLHGDLLTLVCSFAPLRARLLVLPLVSKRWRTCAVASNTELAWNLTPALAAQYPALTAATVGNRFPEAALPTSLRSLTISGPTGLAIDERAPRLPLLARLECRGATAADFRATEAPGEAWRPVLLSFAAKHAATLHHLSAPLLADCVRRYPQLTSLALRYTDTQAPIGALGRMLSLHADQLTELSLDLSECKPHARAALAPLLPRLPRLRRLRLAGDQESLRRVVGLVPAACRVDFEYDGEGEELAPETYPYVTELTVTEAEAPDWTRFSRLEALHLWQPRDDTFARPPPPALRRLYSNDGERPVLAPPDAWFAPLRALEVLAMLDLPFPPPSLSVAALREWYSDWGTLTVYPRGLLTLIDVIVACPALQLVAALNSLPLAAINVADLEAVCRVCEAHGVRELRLTVTGGPDEAKLQRLQQLRRSLKWVRLNYELRVHS